MGMGSRDQGTKEVGQVLAPAIRHSRARGNPARRQVIAGVLLAALAVLGAPSSSLPQSLSPLLPRREAAPGWVYLPAGVCPVAPSRQIGAYMDPTRTDLILHDWHRWMIQLEHCDSGHCLPEFCTEEGT